MARDTKKYIEKNIREMVEEYNRREDITTRFGEPVVAYVSASHPLFDAFFARGGNEHPKKIYRPGYTVIVHFVPYFRGNTEEEKRLAFFESVDLTMRLNRVVREELNMVGRLSSNTCIPIDWNRKTHREDWSSNLAAFIAGIGTMGPAGSFVPARELYPEDAPYWEEGWSGRCGTMITDGLYAPAAPVMTEKELESVFEDVQRACCYTGAADVKCSDEMIAACPCGAVSADGIDMAKCQDYCETINDRTPNPEVCGRCFRR